jgi:serine/threonine protein kinase
MRERTEPILPSPAAEHSAEPSDPSIRSAKTLPASAVASSDEGNWTGRILAGRYELGAILGRGGMGVVYEARQTALGRPVAVKVLRRDLARSTEAVARFQREARAAASIRSPHVVEVFDFGFTEEGDAYIAMERLHGVDLRRLVQDRGPLEAARAVAIVQQIARGLSSAHAGGIVHRDLKSENVIVSERDGIERATILDFGISKIADHDASGSPLTSAGVVMGTPHYMAPELLRGADLADARADLYALGCVLYELLTATLPFSGRTAMEVAYKHVHEPVEPPSTRRRGLGPAFDAIVLRALAKDVNLRIASADELLLALDALDLRAPAVDRANTGLLEKSTHESRPARSVGGEVRPAPSTLESAATALSDRRWIAPRGPLFAVAIAASMGAALIALSPWSTRVSAGSSRPARGVTGGEGASSDAAPEGTEASHGSGGSQAPSADTVRAMDSSAELDGGPARSSDPPPGSRTDPVPGEASERARPDSPPSLRVDRGTGGAARERTSSGASEPLTQDAAAGPVRGLPDPIPRGPDDGLKHSPYGTLQRR